MCIQGGGGGHAHLWQGQGQGWVACQAQLWGGGTDERSCSEVVGARSTTSKPNSTLSQWEDAVRVVQRAPITFRVRVRVRFSLGSGVQCYRAQMKAHDQTLTDRGNGQAVERTT